MPAAAIYTRVSTDEQARHGVSLDAQREACLAYCARSGLVVAAVIVDAGQTSRVPLAQRPAGQEVSALVAAGDVTDVVAYAQSRLFRDSEEAIRVARGWASLGVVLHLLDAGSVAEWEAAQALVGETRGTRGGQARWLTGIYRCAHCGSPVVTWTRNRAQEGQHYLHCWRTQVGLSDCPRTLARLEAADAVIWRHTELSLAGGDLKAALAAYRAQTRRGEGKRGELAARLEELERLQVEAVQAAQGGLMTWEALAAVNRPRVQEGEAIRAQLEALPDAGAEDALAQWTRRGTRKLLEALRLAPVEAQLVALRALYECVEVGGGRMVLRYRLPTIEPVERALPRYWCPSKGHADPGF